MTNQDLHYNTLVRVTDAVSQSKAPEEVFRLTVETLKTALGAKGCSLFLIDEKTQELKTITINFEDITKKADRSANITIKPYDIIIAPESWL